MSFKTVIGRIKLSLERRTHIIQSHPIMEDYLKNLKKVLENPDEVRFSSYNLNILLFYRFFDTIENGKYIVVVVDKIEGLIITAYLTHRIKIGEKYEKN